MFVSRARGMWDDFYALSKRFWYVYVGVLLLEDRAQSWANDQIDKIAPSAAGDVVTTPFLLFIGVIAALGLLAFFDTRQSRSDHARSPVSDTAESAKASMPWVEKAIKQDADDLRAAIPMIDEQPQNGHVLFELDNKHEPSILFHFVLLNASVYTVEITTVEGILQVEGEVIPGRFKIAEAQVPVVFPRRRRYNLFLRFVIDTEATQRVMKELVAQSKEIHCNLDNVRLRVQAKEDPSVAAELRFPQQWWRPSPQPPGYN